MRKATALAMSCALALTTFVPGDARAAGFSASGLTVTIDDATGIVTYFESPTGIITINENVISNEGLMICAAGSPVAYSFFGDGPTWDGPATVTAVPPNGVKINRTAVGGALALEILYRAIPGDRTVKVDMKVTNNSGTDQVGVQISRMIYYYVDLFYDVTSDSVSFRPDPVGSPGMQMTNYTKNPGVTVVPSVEAFPPTVNCTPTNSATAPGLVSQSTARMDYNVGTIPNGGSATVRFEYRRH